MIGWFMFSYFTMLFDAKCGMDDQRTRYIPYIHGDLKFIFQIIKCFVIKPNQ